MKRFSAPLQIAELPFIHRSSLWLERLQLKQQPLSAQLKSIAAATRVFSGIQDRETLAICYVLLRSSSGVGTVRKSGREECRYCFGGSFISGVPFPGPATV